MKVSQLREVFEKTHGHCHFCGDRVVFEKRGIRRIHNLKGYWEVDHVVQRAKGGTNAIDNYLPACTQCNKLRWHRKGKNLRELLVLGLVAQNEIKKNNRIGKELIGLRIERDRKNRRRRMNKE